MGKKRDPPRILQWNPRDMRGDTHIALPFTLLPRRFQFKNNICGSRFRRSHDFATPMAARARRSFKQRRDMPPKLSLSELRARSRARNSSRTQSFDIVLNACHNRIRRSSEMGHVACMFDVPAFILGLPLVQTEACVSHIRQNLERSGLFVEVITSTKLFISWDEEVTGSSTQGGGTGGGSSGSGARITLPF